MLLSVLRWFLWPVHDQERERATEPTGGERVCVRVRRVTWGCSPGRAQSEGVLQSEQMSVRVSSVWACLPPLWNWACVFCCTSSGLWRLPQDQSFSAFRSSPTGKSSGNQADFNPQLTCCCVRGVPGPQLVEFPRLPDSETLCCQSCSLWPETYSGLFPVSLGTVPLSSLPTTWFIEHLNVLSTVHVSCLLQESGK